jgi:histidine triad (HIT) family protein
MPITEEQAKQVKEELLKQLDNFPEDKRGQIETQINSMTTEQVETFIEQNKLTHLGGQCIFCSIVANKTPSYKIAESPDGIAILELNPLSKGHALIIPKEHTDQIPESIKSLAQQVATKLKEKFKPNDVQINELKIMDHALLEVVPIYGNETEKKQASEEELKSLQKQITEETEESNEKVEIVEHKEVEEEGEEDEDIPVIPPRIP